MYNAPYQGVANQLSQYGRFGDSQLVHMNPIEVQMLASLSPTGRLTTNPMTGQQEAFLPFLAPLLGSFLGSSLLTGAGAGALGGLIGTAGLSSAAAGAIGSGLATTLATGDLEQGIMSGLTGFGLGSALGNLSKAVPGVTDAATAGTQAATDAATQSAAQAITPEAINIQPLGTGMGLESQLPTSSLATAPMEQFLPMSQQLDALSQGLQAPLTPAAPAAAAPAELTAMDRLSQPFQRPGEFFSELAKPGSFLPMYVGETGRMAREQELMGRGSMANYEKEQEAERQKTLRQMGDVFNRVRSAYPGVGYAQGGQISSYAVGGSIENAIREAAMRGGYGGEYGGIPGAYNMPSAEDVQLSWRGAEYVPPPAASYSALDVGGEGYMPGVAPEFQYFREPPPPPPAAIAPPPPGSIAGGEFPPGGMFGDIDFSQIDFGNLPGYQGRDFTMPAQDFQQPPSQPPISPAVMPDFNFSDLYSGIGSFNMPDVPMQGMPDQNRILASRELQVPVGDFMMPNQDMGRDMIMPDLGRNPMIRDRMRMEDDEFNPFSMGRDDMDFRAAGGMMYAEGGMTGPEPVDQTLVEMTVAAIRGEVENADEIISRFLDMYGPEAFTELRDQVLQDIVPGAQTEGMIQGMGGGQDDMVEGMIGTQRPVAVSPGEYIIPADVVSLAGGGYSGDGAKYFDGLIEDIRMKTMGKTDQIKPYQGRAS